MSDDGDGRAAPVDASRFEREWRWVILALTGFGILGALLYGGQFGWRTFLRVAGVSAVVAGSAALAGGVLGFLFGVPFTRTDQDATDQTPYRPNTSLEQVSDWLTKIIVGIGLVQIGRAPDALGSLAGALGPAFAPVSPGADELRAAETFSVALALYFAVAGFLAGFLWARLSLPRAFRSADVLQQIKELRARQEELDARALTLLERALTPDPGGSAPSQADLQDALRAATAPVRVQVFNRARAFRKENTDKVKRPSEVARTIPVFRALAAIDTANRYHRNYAQLGYAQMETDPPAEEDAVASFSTAIELRGDWRRSGFLLYEYCRALCRIRLDVRARRAGPAPEGLRRQIVDDVAAVATVPDLLRQFLDEDGVPDWLGGNGVDAAQLTRLDGSEAEKTQGARSA